MEWAARGREQRERRKREQVKREIVQRELREKSGDRAEREKRESVPPYIHQ